MLRAAPFKGVRFDPSQDLGRALCPPYDVISPELAKSLRSRARNSVQLELPQGGGAGGPASEQAPLPEAEVAFPLAQHDVVVIFDALHHTHDERAVLANILTYLKPGGVLVLAEPNVVHEHDHDSVDVVERFGTTERGLTVAGLRRLCRDVGFERSWRYHASGQSFEPRHEGFVETLKMIVYPLLARVYFGRKRTRIWLVAQKADRPANFGKTSEVYEPSNLRG